MTKKTVLNAELRHLTVLEEAHNILKRTSSVSSNESSNLVGKSVEMISNSIAEMRTYGEGFIIADQAPGLLDMAAIRNTNTTIIMRLPDQSDRELVGRAANLNDDQITELAKLPCGVAAIYQNEWVQPVLCKINRYRYDDKFRYEDEYVAPKKADIDIVSRIRIADLISEGIKLDCKDDILYLKEMMRSAKISAYIQIKILEILKNPSNEPKMTKIAPIMTELFPEVYKAIKVAFSETKNEKAWTLAAEKVLFESTGININDQTRRDIIQAIITHYIYNERHDVAVIEKWAKYGLLK